MAIEFNDNIHVKINRPTDFRFGPFESIAQANSLIPIAQRYHGLIFGVYTDPLDIANSDVDFYYYYDGLTDTDYLPFGGSDLWTDVGTYIYRNSPVLIGDTTKTDTGAIFETVGRISTRDFGIGSNTFIGFEAGKSFTYPHSGDNTALGYKSLEFVTTGYYNTSLGHGAGNALIAGTNNTFVGRIAALSNTNGNFNTIVGSTAFYQDVTGSQNTAMGYGAMLGSLGTNNNVAIGHQALLLNDLASENTVIGSRVAENLRGTANNGQNVVIGYFAAQANLSLQNSVIIGRNARPSGNGQINTIVIGHDLVGNGSNTTTIGNDNTTKTFLKGKLQISPILETPIGDVTDIGIDSAGNIVAGTGGGGGEYTASTGLEMVGTDVRLGVLYNSDSGRRVDYSNFGSSGNLSIYGSYTNPSNVTVSSTGYFTLNKWNNNFSIQGQYLLETVAVNNSNSQNSAVSVDGQAEYNKGFYWTKVRTRQAAGVLRGDSSTNGTTDYASMRLYAENYQSTLKEQSLNVTTYESATFKDTVLNRGIIYAGDYEANFLARSLVTKQYVDGLVGGGGFSVAGRGLSSSGSTVNFGDLVSGSDYRVNLAEYVSAGQGSLSFYYNPAPARFDYFGISMNTNNASIEMMNYGISDAGAIVRTYANDTSGNLLLEVSNNSYLYSSIKIDSSAPEIMVVMDEMASKGLVYEGDYEANFTARSLVTKQYVDSQVGSPITASNGLNKVGNDIRLGDAYISYTPNSDYNVTFSSAGGVYAATYHTINSTATDKSYVGSEIYNESGKGGSVIEQFENTTSGGYRLWVADGAFDLFQIELVKSFSPNSFSATITDQINSKGFVYGGNYEANFTARSLITKQYADENNIIASPPASSSSPGSKGQIAYDANFMYLCVATNTWIRAAISNSF